MDRRHFTRLASRGLALGMVQPALGIVRPRLRQPPDLLVDGDRLNRTLTELARFGATPDGGVSRVAYSDADLAAREWVAVMGWSACSYRRKLNA